MDKEKRVKELMKVFGLTLHEAEFAYAQEQDEIKSDLITDEEEDESNS